MAGKFRIERCITLGFTLVELLVVMAVVAVLISILLPALRRSRQVAIDVQCANNIRQIVIALNAYFVDHGDTIFWRGSQSWVVDPVVGGMDWYVYGGRETGNNPGLQANFFNVLRPRPLNQYVDNYLETFHCPYDNLGWDWAGFEVHFDWVGNSYLFNTYGWSLGPHNGGLAGVSMTQVQQPSRTLLFMDASLVRSPGSWHHEEKGNISFCDGHVEFLRLPSPFDQRGLTWNPN